jgi:hypothetical protein
MRPEDVIMVGTLRTIAHARDASGRARAQTFLDEECPPADRERLHRLFRLIAYHGERAATQEAFKHEVGAIHAFKGKRARLAAFRSGNIWLLTNGFLKQRDRWPIAELHRAARIRMEHMSREGIG